MAWMCMPAVLVATPARTASRSCRRYAGASSFGKALRNCCTVQAVVGCSVTATWTIRRRSCASMMSTKSIRSVTVGTTKRSTAGIWLEWFVRNVRQVCDGCTPQELTRRHFQGGSGGGDRRAEHWHMRVTELLTRTVNGDEYQNVPLVYTARRIHLARPSEAHQETKERDGPPSSLDPSTPLRPNDDVAIASAFPGLGA